MYGWEEVALQARLLSRIILIPPKEIDGGCDVFICHVMAIV